MRVSWVTGNASQTPAVRFRQVALPVPGGVEGTIELEGAPLEVVSWQARTMYAIFCFVFDRSIVRYGIRAGSCPLSPKTGGPKLFS